MAVTDEVMNLAIEEGTATSGLYTTTITDATSTVFSGPIKFTGMTGTVLDEVPIMDPKTERLEKRVIELEGHLCDLIDVVAHLRAELYDA
jgi:hypothetical protein